jgi:hypothetical protein
MLFMHIYSWEPGQRDELIKRRTEKKGSNLSEGLKKVAEWCDVSGGRGFLICEANDPKAIMTSVTGWSDLMKQEIFPLLEWKKKAEDKRSNRSGF